MVVLVMMVMVTDSGALVMVAAIVLVVATVMLAMTVMMQHIS